MVSSYQPRFRGGSDVSMSQNYPGGDPSYPGNPNNPLTKPQQPDHQPDAMRQPQQKHSGRGEVIGWYIAATVLMLICVGAGLALYIGPQLAKDAIRSGAAAIGASSQVSQFCDDYRLQDYGDAYQHLSAAAQGR